MEPLSVDRVFGNIFTAGARPESPMTIKVKGGQAHICADGACNSITRRASGARGVQTSPARSCHSSLGARAHLTPILLPSSLPHARALTVHVVRTCTPRHDGAHAPVRPPSAASGSERAPRLSTPRARGPHTVECPRRARRHGHGLPHCAARIIGAAASQLRPAVTHAALGRGTRAAPS